MKKSLVITSLSVLAGAFVLVAGIGNALAVDNFGLFNGNVFQNNSGNVNTGSSQNCTTGNATSQGGTATSGNCSNDVSIGNVLNSNQNSGCGNCSPTPQPTPSPTPTNPPTGGENPNGGNNPGSNPTGSSCPTNTNLQSVDPVWVTDVTATSLIVHWSNKGDANAYQIAYGPASNKYQWGVKVGGNLNNFQINQIPSSLKIVVTVFPVKDDCAGNASGQPATLAATGFASNIPLYLSGMALIGLGLTYAQKRLKIKA